MTQTFEYLPSRDGLALQTGGPTQAGYRAARSAHRAGLWQPRFPTEASPKGHSNSPNGEYQFYADPEYAWDGGFSPFSIVDGVLQIRAERTEATATLAGDLPDNPLTHKPYGWISGVLTSKGAFSQQGGYFEIDAKMPKGVGTWPAFWLLPVNDLHPPELDVIEYLGHEPRQYRATWISPGPQFHATKVLADVDLSQDFHRYGLLWTDTALIFYLDGVEAATSSIVGRREFGQDFYLIVNLAIGSDKSDWVPPPCSQTPSPVDLLVRSVKAWQRRGPWRISLSRNVVNEDAPPGSTVATLSCLTDETGANVTYSLLADPSGVFKIAGATLATRGKLSFLRLPAHDCIIGAEDAHGRRWQQPALISVIDSGLAPNALAPGSQETLAHPAWKTFGTRVVTAAGTRTEVLLEEEGASVHAIEQLIVKARVAQRYIVSADLAPHGRNFVKIEVSRNYGKNVQAIFDLTRYEISGATASMGEEPFRLNDVRAFDLRNSFCRCLLDLTTDQGATLRVSIKLVGNAEGQIAPSSTPEAGIRSGAFFRAVKVGEP